MSPSDVPPDEMGMDPSATDAFERMLSGSSADDEWRDVAGFVQELQEAVPSSGKRASVAGKLASLRRTFASGVSVRLSNARR